MYVRERHSDRWCFVEDHTNNLCSRKCDRPVLDTPVRCEIICLIGKRFIFFLASSGLRDWRKDKTSIKSNHPLQKPLQRGSQGSASNTCVSLRIYRLIDYQNHSIMQHMYSHYKLMFFNHVGLTNLVKTAKAIWEKQHLLLGLLLDYFEWPQ